MNPRFLDEVDRPPTVDMTGRTTFLGSQIAEETKNPRCRLVYNILP